MQIKMHIPIVKIRDIINPWLKWLKKGTLRTQTDFC